MHCAEVCPQNIPTLGFPYFRLISKSSRTWLEGHREWSLFPRPFSITGAFLISFKISIDVMKRKTIILKHLRGSKMKSTIEPYDQITNLIVLWVF